MNKKLIRLTESDLHRIVKESVNRVLRESNYEYGKTIRHIPNQETPIPYDPTDSIMRVAREFLDFKKTNPELIKSLFHPDYFRDDGYMDELKNAEKELGMAFAKKMGYDYNYIKPALRYADSLENGEDFNTKRIRAY